MCSFRAALTHSPTRGRPIGRMAADSVPLVCTGGIAPATMILPTVTPLPSPSSQSTDPMTGQKLLVANRGEIAIRIFRSAADLGMGSIAIYPGRRQRQPACREGRCGDRPAGTGRRRVSRWSSHLASGKRGGCDGNPPRLRLPVGECGLRARLCRCRRHLCRPDARDPGAVRRQAPGQAACARGRCADPAGHGGAHDPRGCPGVHGWARRRRGRDGQGGRRRRRPRHAPGPGSAARWRRPSPVADRRQPPPSARAIFTSSNSCAMRATSRCR